MAMTRFPQKHISKTNIVFVWLIAILGAALIANLFWASFSSGYLFIASNLVTDNSAIEPIPNATSTIILNKEEASRNVKKRYPARFLTGAYADLPAPDLHWEEMPPAPVPRLDGASIQIKNLFYVFAGYGSIDHVHSHVDIFNFSSNKWVERFDMPKDMGHSHLGVATDGRYIYAVSGQYGPQCRRPTSRVFVLDSQTKKWKSLPPLPAPRYAPATQLWRGRLHVMGGSKENRHTPGVDHWSLAVKDGEALEKQWRTEIPIPRGGPHRACIAANDRLYIIGGQEGDFMAKPGSPIFKCSRRHEVSFSSLFINIISLATVASFMIRAAQCSHRHLMGFGEDRCTQPYSINGEAVSRI